VAGRPALIKSCEYLNQCFMLSDESMGHILTRQPRDHSLREPVTDARQAGGCHAV